jgi:hypothetical protein
MDDAGIVDEFFTGDDSSEFELHPRSDNTIKKTKTSIKLVVLDFFSQITYTS